LREVTNQSSGRFLREAPRPQIVIPQGNASHKT